MFLRSFVTLGAATGSSCNRPDRKGNGPYSLRRDGHVRVVDIFIANAYSVHDNSAKESIGDGFSTEKKVSGTDNVFGANNDGPRCRRLRLRPPLPRQHPQI